MLVSAISQNRNNGYNMSSNMPFYNSRSNETIGDTAFNSLTPYVSKKVVSVCLCRCGSIGRAADL